MSPDTTQVLNRICNAVERIAASMSKGDKGSGASAGEKIKNAGNGGLFSKENASTIKDLGTGVKDLATGLLKFEKAQKSTDKLVSFLRDLGNTVKDFATDETNEGLRALSGLFRALDSLSPLKLVGLSLAFVVFSPAFALFGLSLRLFPTKISDQVAPVLNALGNAFIRIAGGIAMLALTFVLSSLALQNVGMAGGFIGMFVAIGGVLLSMFVLKKIGAVKAMSSVGKAIMQIGAGVAIMTLTFVLSTLALQKVSPGAFAMGAISIFIALGGVLVGMLVLSKLGAVRAMTNVGKGIMGLGAGLAVFTLVFLLSGLAFAAVFRNMGMPEPLASVAGGIVGGIAPLALLWGTLKIISMFGSKKAQRGMRGLRQAGIGLILFGVGMFVVNGAFLASMTMANSFAPEVMIGGTNWGPAIAMLGPLGWLLGVGLIARFIYGNAAAFEGALAIGAVGVGLIPFAAGLLVMSEAVRGLTPVEMAAIPGAVLALGVEAAAAGAAAVLIIPGAAAIGALGLALLPFAAGVFAMSKIFTSMSQDDRDKFGDRFKQVMEAFYDGMSLKMVSFFLAAGPGLIALGLGLVPFSAGLFALTHVIKDEETAKVGARFKDILSSMSDAMKEADLSMKSIIAVSMIGPALKMLAYGVSAWMSLDNMKVIDYYDKDGRPVYSKDNLKVEDAINNIRNFLDPNSKVNIIGVFSDFAKNNQDILEPGFLGISSSPFVNGIMAVRKIGFALSGLAMGVASWMSLQNLKVIDHYDKNGKPVYSKTPLNISTAIKNIRDFLDPNSKVNIIGVFSDFAEQNKDLLDTGFLGISESPLVNGVNAVKKIGDALSVLAQSTSAWMSLENVAIVDHYDENGKPVYSNKKANIEQAIKNIRNFLMPAGNISILDAFATFGKDYEKQRYNVDRGINALPGWIDRLITSVEGFQDKTDAIKVLGDNVSQIAKVFASSNDPKKPNELDGALKNFDMLSNSMVKFNMSSLMIRKNIKVIKDLNNEVRYFTRNLLQVPETTWTILKDLTLALNEFTKKDHAENLLKSAVALQAALTEGISVQNSGNPQLEAAKTSVEQEGIRLPENAVKGNFGGDKKEKSPIDALKADIAAIKESMEKLVDIVGDEHKVYVVNNPLENS